MFTMVIALALSLVFLLLAGLEKKKYGNKNKQDFPDEYMDYINYFYLFCSLSAVCFIVFASYVLERL